MGDDRRILLSDEPVATLDDYLAGGGGEGLERAHRIGPEATIAEIRRSGLRGRGGAGFPTGIKWEGLRADPSAHKYVVANAAEGEPGTFKDRWLLRNDPFQFLEGLAIAAFAVGAGEAFIGIKAKFALEIARLESAAASMAEQGLVGDPPITIVRGPDDYLFGEEKALLEVIEGRDALPRLFPPYVQGLFAAGDDANPAAVNNVETLSNVPHVLGNGADWYRSYGTEDSPGTMVFTVGGDVLVEAVAELELGTPLASLLYQVGGGLQAGRRLKMVVSGVSNRPLPPSRIDTPLEFGGMKAAGSGLGSGGFIVYDDTVCVAQVGAALSGFLYRASCGQCPPCKLGTQAITGRLTKLADGGGGLGEIEELLAWVAEVTDANRCGLGAGQQALAEGLLADFTDDLGHHIDGRGCPSDRTVRPPVIEDWDQLAGKFVYASPKD